MRINIQERFSSISRISRPRSAKRWTYPGHPSGGGLGKAISRFPTPHSPLRVPHSLAPHPGLAAPKSDEGGSRSAHSAGSLFNPINLINSFNRASRAHERGIALVITLILLSVITFMAVTFLVVTQGERKSVVTLTDQMTAKEAAESGFEFVKVAVLAPMIASNNLNTLQFLVSTNFFNPNGFVSSNGYDPNNVNYDYKAGGGALTTDDLLQNIANLRYLPRAPVVVSNSVTTSNEFRYYVDLNRNGKFDPTGVLGVTNATGIQVKDAEGNVVTNFFWGDPQWIGILQRPGYPHSSSNFFVARYAFMVVPSSTTLDINTAHNFSKGAIPILAPPNMGSGKGDRFLRDMGVGTYEINLGAFLTDLNTNYWPPENAPASALNYDYLPLDLSVPNQGAGFEDAVALLRYRYGQNRDVGTVPVGLMFGKGGSNGFRQDFFDGYSAGPVMTNLHWTVAFDPEAGGPLSTVGWPGSENTNRFYDIQELFDTNKSAINVTGTNISIRLTSAGGSLDTYNRYTFYRLLAQLGTDSGPDVGKINPNYRNMANGVIVPDMATNFLPWSAEEFVTNAAIRLLVDAYSQQFTNAISTNLLTYTNFGQYAITNYLAGLVETNPSGVIGLRIQVYPTNFYTPSVQHYLQLAVNIYDASLNRTNFTPYPTVLRPLFSQAPGNVRSNAVYIIGYRELTNSDFVISGSSSFPFFHDLTDPNNTIIPTNSIDMVYGVPLLIGAKKGLPNLNEFALQTDIQVIRKLHFQKPSLAAPVNITNQIYTLFVSNVMKLEAWNSYVQGNLTRDPTKPFQVFCRADVTLAMTNEFGLIKTPFSTLSNLYSLPSPPTFSPTPYGITNYPNPAIGDPGWQGWTRNVTDASFKVPMDTNFIFLTTNVNFSFNQNSFVTASYPDPANVFPIPHWWLLRKVRLQAAIVDNAVTPPRIIDYMNLVSSEDPVNITGEMIRDADCQLAGGPASTAEVGYFFCTNRIGNPSDLPKADSPSVLTYGIKHQLNASSNPNADGSSFWWIAFGTGDIVSQTAAFFNRINNLPGGQDTTDFNAPFTPYRILHYYLSWQANDPLVHFTTADLTDLIGLTAGTNRIEMYDAAYKTTQPYATVNSPIKNVGSLNHHYRPWVSEGDTKAHISYDPQTDKSMDLKDPMVRQSADWDFPTNKFPNVGWLGRVHRGTPWQTVYLKSPLIQPTNWVRWSGHTPITNWDNQGTVLFDYFHSLPTNDFHIADLFTTAINDNSSRGKLSVNQTNLAAWSAVLSGVNVMPTTSSNMFIQPAGVYFTNTLPLPPLVQIVNGINLIRTNFPGGAFGHTGDILFTPEFTTNSPFLNKTNLDALNDEVYERIPQQVLGLLRGGDQPRFVVYAFGQALRPAERSIMNNGEFFGMCTNYQVTAESTIRAVVRIDGSTDPSQANNADPAKRYPPRAVIESYNVIGPYY